MDEKKQEVLFRLSVLEQQIQNLQQQLRAVEESIIDISALKLGLDDIKNSVGKDMMAPLGRGIFVKAKLLSDAITVDVGGRNFVSKTVPETKEIIDAQMKKLQEIQDEINKRLDESEKEVHELIDEAQNSERD